jgi:hypothetical protein
MQGLELVEKLVDTLYLDAHWKPLVTTLTPFNDGLDDKRDQRNTC